MERFDDIDRLVTQFLLLTAKVQREARSVRGHYLKELEGILEFELTKLKRLKVRERHKANGINDAPVDIFGGEGAWHDG